MTEIKSYAKPPTLVEKVMEAVMILRGQDPTWSEAKRQLGNARVVLHVAPFVALFVLSEFLCVIHHVFTHPFLYVTHNLVFGCVALFSSVPSFLIVFPVLGYVSIELGLFRHCGTTYWFKHLFLYCFQFKTFHKDTQIPSLMLWNYLF